MTTIKFRDKEFEITVLPGTMHPGFATYTFTTEEKEFREKYWDIKPGDHVVDVGAAYGSYTLPALAMGAKVVAFEPEAKIIDNLIANIRLNGFYHRCAVEQIGLWDEDLVDIDIKSYAPHYATQLTSPTYQMRTLDTLFYPSPGGVNWIKIDVEGAEEKVVVGGMKTIEAYKPKLIIECDDFIDVDIKTRIADKLKQWYHFEIVPRDPCSFLVGMPK